MQNIAYDTEFSIIFCLTNDGGFNFENSVGRGGCRKAPKDSQVCPVSYMPLSALVRGSVTAGDALGPERLLCFAKGDKDDVTSPRNYVFPETDLGVSSGICNYSD